MAPRFRPTLLAVLFSALLLSVACGGGGGDSAPKAKDNPPIGAGESGVDLGAYSNQETLGTMGGSVSIPGGPSLTVPLGALGRETGLALRPAAKTHALPSRWQAVSSWFDLGSSYTSTLSTPANPLTLSLPITPPSGSENHPGLQLLAVQGGLSVPIDGHYDAASGQFVVKLLGLPASFSFCVAFNSHIKRLTSADLSGRKLAAKPQAATGWSTVNWGIDWDEQLLTATEIENVLKWGAQAATIYSGEGFKEPFLYKDSLLSFEYYHLHLIASGSNYDSNTDTTAADAARHFGRLNLAVADIRQPSTNPYGGGYSILAHEMFHSVFESYGVPSACLDDFVGGVKYCYQTTAGFNEGLATAVAYHLEQGGEAQPRPDLSPNPLERPFGYVNVNHQSMAYQNQDFIIYLLRMGSLSTIRQLVEALSTAVVPKTGTLEDALLGYAQALEGASLGFPESFHKVYATYAADRAYIRSSAGRIWPDEPDAENPGAVDTWAQSLFPKAYTIMPKDCRITQTESLCTVTFSNVEPLTAHTSLLDLSSSAQVPPNYQMASMTLKVELADDGGQSSLWVFSEVMGKGSPEGRSGDLDGKTITIKDAVSKWNTFKILFMHGATKTSTVTLTVKLLAGDASEACQMASDWMCKCQASGKSVGCAAYDIAVAQLCANLPPGSSCDEQCAALAESYINAYGDEDPSMWNAMCSANPR